MSEGTYFGKYFLIKRIAQGGMGEIYLARQKGPGGFSKTVVLKKLLPHLSENKEFVDGFLGEAALSAKMSHRNVVTVFDFGLDEESGSYFLTMEYVSGKPLNHVLEEAKKRKTRLPIGLIREVAVQMCEGMSYAHNLTNELGAPLNLVHRDLNPSNLLCSFTGDVKIIDWGIAKSEMSQVKTEAGMIKGKFVYMSPEQSMAEVLDKRSDIFAAGITLYEMLVGENPFHKANVVLSLEAIQRVDPPRPGEIDPELAPFDAIVMKAISKNAADRYDDCLDMAEALKALTLPQSPERLGAFVAKLFPSAVQEEQKLMQATGRGRVTPPVAQRPAPEAEPDGEGSTILISEPPPEIAQSTARLDVTPRPSRTPAPTRAPSAMRTPPPTRRPITESQRTVFVQNTPAGGEAVTLPPDVYEGDSPTLFIGSPELHPPPPRHSRVGLFVGVGLGILVGLIGVVAFILGEKRGDHRATSTASAAPVAAPVQVIVPMPGQIVAQLPVQVPAQAAMPAAAQPSQAAVAVAVPAPAPPAPVAQPAPVAAVAHVAAQAAAAAPKATVKAPSSSASAKSSLQVSVTPSMSIALDGRPTQGTLRIDPKKEQGSIAIGGDDDELRINLDYRLADGAMQAEISTEPWSLVTVNGAFRGKTPQVVEISGATVIDFKRPGLEVQPSVRLKYSP